MKYFLRSTFVPFEEEFNGRNLDVGGASYWLRSIEILVVVLSDGTEQILEISLRRQPSVLRMVNSEIYIEDTFQVWKIL